MQRWACPEIGLNAGNWKLTRIVMISSLLNSKFKTQPAKLRRVPAGLWVPAGLAALLAAIPLAYVALRAAQGDAELWQRVLNAQLPGLLANTLLLALLVAGGTALLGTALAWLVERTDLPGRAAWRWLLALPLGMPPYVGAVCYLTLLRPRGLLERRLVELDLVDFGSLPLQRIYGLGGAAAVLLLYTYPYVYLLCGAALRQGSQHLDELARVSGRGPWDRFRLVALPLLRPSIGAGALLAVLYTLADFGVVALLRYQTFSVAIYTQFTGQLDRSGAAILSLPLIGLTLLVLAGEARLTRRTRTAQIGRSWRPPQPLRLGRWRGAALALVALIAGAAIVLPLLLLVTWTAQALMDQSALARIWGSSRSAIWPAAWNSLWTASVAACLTTLLALAPAILVARAPGRASRTLVLLCQAGYALPGVVVALSLVLLINRLAPWLAGTITALLVAYVVRFLPQALQAAHAAALAITPSVEEAARTLGHRPLATLRRITLPLMAPGLASGWALVFLTSLKELPATLLLRPAGFDTLPVRIWVPASEAVYTEAAPAALLLSVCALLPLVLLARRQNGIVPL
jgi:iron(III) transport system permease protein